MGFKTEQPRGELTAVPKGGRRESHSQMIAYTGRLNVKPMTSDTDTLGTLCILSSYPELYG